MDLNPRILVIGDTQAIYDDFRNLLMRGFGEGAVPDLDCKPRHPFVSNLTVHSASQIEAGLALIDTARQQARPYSVALIDLPMPSGRDGISIPEKLWALDAEIQIVLCSERSDHSWEQIVERLGSPRRPRDS